MKTCNSAKIRQISRISACGGREKKHIGMQAGGEARLQGALPAPLLPLHSYSPVHQAVPRADQKGKQAYPYYSIIDKIIIKTPNPKCRLYWCLI
jgi:hypothetical protein